MVFLGGNKGYAAHVEAARELKKAQNEANLAKRFDSESVLKPTLQLDELKGRAKKLELSGELHDAARCYELILRQDSTNQDVKRALACVNQKINNQAVHAKAKERELAQAKKAVENKAEAAKAAAVAAAAAKEILPPRPAKIVPVVPPAQYLKELQQQMAEKKQREAAEAVAEKRAGQQYAAELHQQLRIEAAAAEAAELVKKQAKKQMAEDEWQRVLAERKRRIDMAKQERDASIAAAEKCVPLIKAPPRRARSACPFGLPDTDHAAPKIKMSDVRARMNSYIEKRTKKEGSSKWNWNV